MATPTTPTKATNVNVKPTDVKPTDVKIETPAAVATPPVVAPTKEKKPVQQIVWPTADEALAEAQKRTYGPRKAFTVTVGSTTVHCVAYNDEYAAYEAFIKAGGTITELGGTTRARKISADAVLQAAQAMSPEALAKLKAELAKL